MEQVWWSLESERIWVYTPLLPVLKNKHQGLETVRSPYIWFKCVINNCQQRERLFLKVNFYNFEWRFSCRWENPVSTLQVIASKWLYWFPRAVETKCPFERKFGGLKIIESHCLRVLEAWSPKSTWQLG